VIFAKSFKFENNFLTKLNDFIYSIATE